MGAQKLRFTHVQMVAGPVTLGPMEWWLWRKMEQ